MNNPATTMKHSLAALSAVASNLLIPQPGLVSVEPLALGGLNPRQRHWPGGKHVARRSGKLARHRVARLHPVVRYSQLVSPTHLKHNQINAYGRSRLLYREHAMSF